jgi:hypothetical protein
MCINACAFDAVYSDKVLAHMCIRHLYGIAYMVSAV